MSHKTKLIALLLPLLMSLPTFGTELEAAIKYGNFLTEAVKTKSTVKIKKRPEYDAIKQYLSSRKCSGFKYKAYIVGSENDQQFYLVASKGKSVIIGRHFKAPINGGVIDASAFSSSTNSCLNLGKPASNVAAMYATHLKPYPNEFHLLQSNLKSIALYIGTSAGMYVVENGTMVLSESE